MHSIPDKKRNPPLRTDQLPGRSQGIGQFSLYQCKERCVKYCCVTRLLQSGVKNMLKKICHEPSGGQIVKSQEISVFIMLSCRISSSNENHFSRPNCTQALILCKFYLLINHTR